MIVKYTSLSLCADVCGALDTFVSFAPYLYFNAHLHIKDVSLDPYPSLYALKTHLDLLL